MRTKRVAIIEKREGLTDLEQLAKEMCRLSTDETDDYSRFARRILVNLERLTGEKAGTLDGMEIEP
jgi:hypothetical protein